MMNNRVSFCTGPCHPYLMFFWCHRKWRDIHTVHKKFPEGIPDVGFCQFRENFLWPSYTIHLLGGSLFTYDFTSLWTGVGTLYYWWTRLGIPSWTCGINWHCGISRQTVAITANSGNKGLLILLSQIQEHSWFTHPNIWNIISSL
jgi:hypothetical protein